MDADLKFDLSTVLHQARRATPTLAMASSQMRNAAIAHLAQILRHHHNELLEANTLDLEMSRELALPGLVLHWLKLTPERLVALEALLDQLVQLPDPLAANQASLFALPTAHSYVQTVPRGIIGFIYEAFPELALLLAAMCWKTGNGLLLRGNVAASHSNQVAAGLIHTALQQADLPERCVQMLPDDHIVSVQDLAHPSHPIDLVIPYGRPSLVQQVTQQTTLPVLAPAMGNCYLYWADSCHGDRVRTIIIDSHDGRPDAVNAIEKVLIPPTLKPARLTLLWNALKEQGFEVRGDAEMVAEFPELALAAKEEWQTPYLDRVVAFKMVKDVSAAISWMNRYSSGHADCLVTDSYAESQQFARAIDSALAYINTSPRFSRQYSGPQGTVAFGVCGRTSYSPGMISLETLVTTKHVIQGHTPLPRSTST